MAEKVLCVRPSCFGYNEDTAGTNSFQSRRFDYDAGRIQEEALREFDNFTQLLKANNVDVVVVQDESGETSGAIKTPDSIFPNNWFCTLKSKSSSQSKTLVLFPMCGFNRRAERRISYTEVLRSSVDRVIDYTSKESEGLFLEGTGSLVMDHTFRVCYAAISPRTSQALVEQFAKELDYKPVLFTAKRSVNGELLYHTNVMLSIGDTWAVCCFDIIADENERAVVKETLESSGRKIIEITEAQMNQYCANVLHVRTKSGESITVMSATAKAAFDASQLQMLGRVVSADIPTIERIGGGSARCMLAELYST